ncbi:Nuclear hormone receptor [Aphelenchoides avenae]|nr:Nuclear hormone receptor [Aphelenchus avenae]
MPSGDGKTFFRRKLVKMKHYACKNDGKCAPEECRRCRACRFDRCVLVGMNPDHFQLQQPMDTSELSRAVIERRRKLLEDGYGQCIKGPDSRVPRDCVNGDPDLLKAKGIKMRNWFAINIWLTIELAKTLPVMSKLDVYDQEALMVHVGLANTMLMESFYSIQDGFSTITHPDGQMPINSHLEDEIFVRVMEPLFRTGISVEEYVLLKAIMYCHSDAPGLSPSAQETLDDERNKYAKALLNLTQNTLGKTAGANKYADLIALVDAYFHFAKKHREHLAAAAALFKRPMRRKDQFVDDIKRGHLV